MLNFEWKSLNRWLLKSVLAFHECHECTSFVESFKLKRKSITIFNLVILLHQLLL